MPGHRAINLAEKLKTFDDLYRPRTVAEFNGHDVMVVKAFGDFPWHHHDDTDDFFLVLSGRLRIEMPHASVVLGPGELFIVPRGVKHRPVPLEPVELLLIEPTGTPNTGNPATAAPRSAI